MKLRPIALVLVTFLLLGLVLSQVQLNLLSHYFSTADYRWFLWVLFLLCLQWVVNAIRIQWIARKKCPLGFLETVKLNFAGGLINMVTPMRLGDMSRAFFLKRLGKSSFSQGINFFVFDKVLNFFTLILISGVSLLWLKLKLPGHHLLAISLLGIAALAVGLFFFFSMLGLSLYQFFSIFFLSCASWLLHLVQVHCLFLAFHAKVSLLSVLALTPIAILVSLLPVTLGGMGTRETAMLFLFKPMDPALVMGVSLLFTARYWLEALMGIPFIQGYFHPSPNIP